LELMGKEEEKIAGLPNRPRVCSPQHLGGAGSYAQTFGPD